MKDQDEIYEAATETPAFLGCPAHMPKTLPGGFDGTEPDGTQGGEGVPPAHVSEENRKKLEDSYLSMRGRLEKIADLALAADAKCGVSGRIGQNWMTCTKAIAEIRRICGPDLVEKAQVDDKAAKRAEYFRKHYSFCDGLFPIHFTNTEDGQMASCRIGSRRFTFDMDSVDRGDGTFDCAAVIKDNGKVVATIETSKGKSISGKVVFAAFKAYVKRLGGSNAYKSHGGFLKQAVKRRAAKQQEHDSNAEAAKEVR